MKKIFVVLTALFGITLSAQSSLEQLKIPAGKNLLNNPELKTSSQTPGFPYDWNLDFAERKGSFRYEQDKNGNGILTLLPPVKQKIANWGENQVGLKQSGLVLNPGKKYRFGALIRTKNLKVQRAGIVVYNYAWTKACEIRLPNNTNGWKWVERDAVLPDSKGEEYAFSVFTVKCTAGEISIKSPYLIPVDDAAAVNVSKAPVIHSLRQITPVAPLLAEMSAEKPEMTFACRSVLPKPETEYECQVKIKSPGTEKILAQGVFPLKNNHIRAVFQKLTPGKVILEAALTDKATGKTIAKNSYPATLTAPVKLSRPVEKRLNMLTQRLLTAEAKDGKYLFSAPRDGWVYIALSAGKNNTVVKLNGKTDPVIKAIADRPFETLRHVAKGDHTLEVANSAGGTLIVNSIPEILVNSYPRKEKYKNEGFHPDYLKHCLFPNTTTFGYGYRWRKGQLEELAALGKEVRQQTMHLVTRKLRTRYENPDEMAKRFTELVKQANEVVRGNTFDEIFLNEVLPKWAITQALQRLTGRAIPMYVWSSGTKFDINGLNAAYLSAVANNAGGKGRFLFECYARTQPDEKMADIYLDDYLNEAIRRAKQLMPEAAKSSLMILGCYTNAGGYCTDTFTEPDVKAFWNKVFYKWANDPDFKDLAGVGLYAWNNSNEESLRWVTKLIRHYVIEGNTDDLAAKYGFRYIPGHLKNGDFIKGLLHWNAKGAVKAVTVKNLGRQFQKRMGYPPVTGDTACLFTRSNKAPNTLTTKLTGLTPGKQYVLRYLLTDNADIKAKKPSGKKILLRTQLDGAQNITASSPVAKYLGADGVNIRGYVNNVAVVFKAEKPEVVLTFSDWADSSVPGAPAGQEILLNKVSVNPYFTGAED